MLTLVGPASGQQKLSKPGDIEDSAIALLWKAVPGLYWATMNYGRIFNGYAETDFYWPLRTHTTEGQHGGTSSIIFAVEDNVIESYSQARPARTDWTAKDGSLGRYHTDKWLIAGSTGSFYAVATSDVPTGLRGTWPLRNGRPYWPGRLPPGFTEEDRYNTQAPWALAERECWFVFDDKYNIGKPSLGVEVQEQIYNFARAYAADFDFVDLLIRNTSDKPIENAYFGYYFFLKDDIGGVNDDYLVAVDTDWDEETSNPDVFYVYDPQRDNIPPNHVPALTGVAVLKTPRDMGVTDFHFFEPPGPVTDQGMWPVISSNPNDPDLPGEQSQYFHNTSPDFRIDHTDWIPENKPGGLYWAFVAMTGPFDMAPGDTVWASFALVAGGDETQFFSNVQTLHEMARNGYRGPSAPPEPHLTAVPGDGKVTLYWDTRSERSEDFEGYKLYRRRSGSITAGDWGQEILDPQGKVVGYFPIAQFDKIDGITGPDPLNPYMWLGDDTGLRHTYVDTTVLNGVGYLYALTAYSTGDPSKDLPALENSLSTTAGATPQPGPNGTVPGQAPAGALKMTPADSFWIEVEVMDSRRINGHSYQVTFTDWTTLGPGERVYKQGYNLFDIDTGDTLLKEEPLTDNSGDNTQVVDGFRIKFTPRPLTGEIEKVWNTTSSVRDGSKWPYWDITLYSAAKGLDFVFVIDEDHPAMLPAARGFGSATYTVPVRAFINSTGEEITEYMQVGDWAARFPNDPSYGGSPGEWSLEPGGANWNPAVDERSNTNFADFLIGKDASGKQLFLLKTVQPPDSKPPQSGDAWFVGKQKPFPRDAAYQFKTQKAYVDPSLIDLSQVRVVPNPYFVKAQWDTEARFRRVKFMNLPEVADIYIFTVSGDLVRHIRHHRDFIPPPNLDNPGPYFSIARAGFGWHDWDLVSDNEIEVAYGIYIYVVVTPDGRKTTGKLAIIR